MKILVMYSNSPPSAAHLEKLTAIAPHFRIVEVTDKDVALTHAPDTQIILGHRYLWQVLPLAKRLRWVQSTAAGVEHLFVPALYQRRPLLTRCPIFADVIARHALSLALAVIRRIPEAHAAQLQCEWRMPDDILPWPRKALILGLGAIGTELAGLLRRLGLQVRALVRTVTAEREALCDGLVGPNNWKTVLTDTDVLFNCLPGSPSTAGIVNAEALDRLPAHAVVVNVGRAGTLDTRALIECLKRGHLGGAALDVADTLPQHPDDPLWHCPHLLITPKMSVFDPDRQDRLERFIENQLAIYLSNGSPQHKVDLPAE